MAAQILARAGPAFGVAGLSRTGPSKRYVIARAKETREYREDTGEVTVAGGKDKQGGDGSLYADQVPAQARKKDNLSKEMKERLRKEYVGFGGAENKPMGSNYFLWIAVIVAVLAVMSKMIGAI